jgi:hypothetical protein
MKKVFYVLAAALMAVSMSVNAAEFRGKFIHLDNSTNKNLKPQVAFCQEHKDGKDVTTFIVKTVNTDNYNEFTDASRILIKFSDQKNFRMNRVAGVGVKQYKNTEKVAKATVTKYWTEVSYEVAPEIIEKLESGFSIVKVRVVYKENDAKDYDLTEGYQPKFSADLLKSYKEAAEQCRKANGDLSDEDF